MSTDAAEPDSPRQPEAGVGERAIELAAALLVTHGAGSWQRALVDHGDDGRAHCERCGGQRRPCTMFVIAARSEQIAAATPPAPHAPRDIARSARPRH